MGEVLLLISYIKSESGIGQKPEHMEFWDFCEINCERWSSFAWDFKLLSLLSSASCLGITVFYQL